MYYHQRFIIIQNKNFLDRNYKVIGYDDIFDFNLEDYINKSHYWLTEKVYYKGLFYEDDIGDDIKEYLKDSEDWVSPNNFILYPDYCLILILTFMIIKK